MTTDKFDSMDEASRTLKISDYAPNAFKGDTPERRDVIEGRFARGKVHLLAGQGGVGKSLLLLQAFEAVNGGAQDWVLGGKVVGDRPMPCIAIMGEDDFGTIDLRLRSIRHGNQSGVDWGAIIPAPNIQSGMALVRREYDGSIRRTPRLDQIELQLDAWRAQGHELGFFVIDTFSTLLGVDANKPEEVQAVMSILSSVATRHDIAVIVTHHLRKGNEDHSADGLRAAIRGSSAMVDAVRAAYVMRQYDDDDAKALTRELELDEPGDIVELRIVKNNLGLKSEPVVFVRQSNGLLRDITRLVAKRQTPEDALWQVVQDANQAGRMLHRSGNNGIFANKAKSWPAGLGLMSKAKLESLTNDLVDAGRLEVTKGGLVACNRPLLN